MAAVMYQAAQAEDETSHEVSEKIARLEYENSHLREVLQLSYPVCEDGVDLQHNSSNYSQTTAQQQLNDPQEKKSPSSKWTYNSDRF